MARKSKRYFWHVPPVCWYGAAVPLVAPSGVPNVGADIVVPLIDSDAVTSISAKPDVDQYVVTRIVGQYMVGGNEAIAASRFMCHRIYPCDADETALGVRNLFLEDDAETDFLWNLVTPWAAAYDGLAWGSWASAAAGNPFGGPNVPRWGHVDVRVNRRIEQGRALVWHTQFALPVPEDDTFILALWLRLLVREG